MRRPLGLPWWVLGLGLALSVLGELARLELTAWWVTP
jgi:hypothetical protein